MTLNVFDSRQRKKVLFEPIAPNKVRMYVCGVTVYDHCHIGHGRAYVTFDVIVRYFEFLGYQVTYVRNITDIDDKIINKAKEINGKTPLLENCEKVTSEFTEYFNRTMNKLGLRKPDKEPKATEHIAEMIELIEQLLKNKCAYEAKGDVWFDIGAWNKYGSLSGRSLEELKAGARVEVSESKRNPMDFALWKKAKEGEPAWESPWGMGRPGWHLECSAMSMKYLGIPFDIHGGGQDLIFPHHENEKAQSEAAAHKEFVRYWLHNGFVTLNEEKMSKSTGNFFVLKDVFEKYDPMWVRYYYLTQHYRSPMEFNLDVLKEIEEPYRKIQNCLNLTEQFIQEQQLKEDREDKGILAKFKDDMNDDFNTPRALALVLETVSAINSVREKREFDSEIHAKYNALKKILSVLGLTFSKETISTVRATVSGRLTDQQIEDLLKKSDCTDEQLNQLAYSREALRKEKKFDLADAIRDKITQAGFLIEDTPEGARIRKNG